MFRFAAKKGQRVVAECFAQRLDSQLDATLTLTDSEGKQLAANGDYAGKDPLVEFVAPNDGDYFVTINDLSFRGGFPYRLVISDAPHVENVFPRIVQAGKKAELTVYGRNLGSGAKPSPWSVNELSLDTLAESVAPPDDILKRGLFRFSEHPTGHSVLPTAATCTLHGFQHRGVPLLVSDIAVSLEQEPNDDPLKPQTLTLPVALAGRFDKERDADWYEIEPPESGSYSFEVYCERIAGRADPYLVVLDEKDGRVAELDDFGIRANAFDGHLRDPQGVVSLTAKKKYRVLVQDRYRRGGARYQYALDDPQSGAGLLPRGHPPPEPRPRRHHGSQGRRGVPRCRDSQQGRLRRADHHHRERTAEGTARRADHDQQRHARRGRPVGRPRRAGLGRPDHADRDRRRAMTRDVRPYTRVWNSTDLNSSRPTRELVVAVAGEAAPFALAPAVETVEVEAGKKVDVVVKADRLWPEFKGNITLIPLSFPNPIKMNTATIAEGKTEVTVTFEVQANARPGEYTVAITGQGQVPFTKDPKAAARPNTLVPTPSRPITLVVVAAKK